MLQIIEARVHARVEQEADKSILMMHHNDEVGRKYILCWINTPNTTLQLSCRFRIQTTHYRDLYGEILLSYGLSYSLGGSSCASFTKCR